MAIATIQHELPNFFEESKMDIEMDSPSFLSSSIHNNILNDFCLVKNIGSGKYGQVHLITHKATKQSFAIKTMSQNQKYFSLLKEASTLKKLNHPNINKPLYYQESTKETNEFLIMEYEENGDLLENILQFGRIDDKVIRYYLNQIIDILEYLKGRNLSHNDIKPENFLLNKTFDLKLIDFGFVSNVNHEAKNYCGTEGYQSPQLFAKKQYDTIKNDIFSIGVLLFIMFTASFPFNNASLNDKLYYYFCNNNKKFWEIHQKRNSSLKFSSEFISLINNILAYSPDQRYSIEQIKASSFFNQQSATTSEVLNFMKLRKQ